MTFHEACQEKEETSGVISGLSKTMGLNFTGLATSFFYNDYVYSVDGICILQFQFFYKAVSQAQFFARPRKSQSTVCMDLF